MQVELITRQYNTDLIRLSGELGAITFYVTELDIRTPEIAAKKVKQKKNRDKEYSSKNAVTHFI